jgi:hypothetical protein
MNIEDFDGYIEIRYSYEASGVALTPGRFSLTRAYGVLHRGRFVAQDVGGAYCVGRITGHESQTNTLVYTCVWDASVADPDLLLLTATGQPTRGRVEYAGQLKYGVAGHTLVASGKIIHGAIPIDVTIRRVGPLPATTGGKKSGK